MAAFQASLPFEAVPLSDVATPRKRKMPNLPLAQLLTLKTAAWALAGVVTAGAATAAGAVAFTSSGPTHEQRQYRRLGRDRRQRSLRERRVLRRRGRVAPRHYVA
jgi:hypothetical protein